MDVTLDLVLLKQYIGVKLALMENNIQKISHQLWHTSYRKHFSETL